VTRWLQSDVPVCCLISGGVDSASILAMVKERKPDVVAYTIVFDEEAEDRKQARFIADWLGVELREVPVPVPTEADLRAAIECIEITMKAQIEIALHCLPLAERIYADGFRVVLSGEGADELFGGYGMLARRSKTHHWGEVRLEGVEKMARGNFVRINKAFMAHGVEARTPFMDKDLVEAVLPLVRDECPEQKVLLREAVRGLLPEETRLRKKVSFQSGSGMRDHFEAKLNGGQQIEYNRIARELFGGLPRG
jgi:asparagine synthase (glutamine-hydrolysing)